MFQDKVDNIKHKIEDLEKSITTLEGRLDGINNDSKRYEAFWDLKELHEQTKEKYRSLEIWSDETQTKKFDNNLIQEIYYFELCLSMLKKKHGTQKIDMRHFLNIAELEYHYFNIRENPLPSYFLNLGFQLEGPFSDLRINLIFNNLLNAKENLELLIEYYNREESHKDLFIYYELMGDLFIHLFCYFKKYFNEEYSVTAETPRSYLFCTFYYYRLSIWHKNELAKLNPRTGFDGLHGWPSQALFHDFLDEIGVKHITDVHEKERKMSQKYHLRDNEKENLNDNIRRRIREFLK